MIIGDESDAEYAVRELGHHRPIADVVRPRPASRRDPYEHRPARRRPVGPLHRLRHRGQSRPSRNGTHQQPNPPRYHRTLSAVSLPNRFLLWVYLDECTEFGSVNGKSLKINRKKGLQICDRMEDVRISVES